MRSTGYFVAPAAGPGPGVLLLHSWWGLTPFFKRTADRIADAGFSVLAPDLNDGETFDDPARAEQALQEANADVLAHLTLTAAGILAERSARPADPIGVVGFSMGGSLGLWASVRIPGLIGAVVSYYGAQQIDFDGARSAYQLHLAGRDHLVTEDEAVFMEATIGLEELTLESFRYPGVGHWFFEADRPNYDPAAAKLSWDRTVSFLRRELSA